MNDGGKACKGQSDENLNLSEPLRLIDEINKSTGYAARPNIGQRMADGTVYAGVSPDTGRAMYAAPADSPLQYSFKQAQDYAANSDECGHHDWRLPSKNELAVLFNNRAKIWGYRDSAAFSLKYNAAKFLAVLFNDESVLNRLNAIPRSWYWSSTEASKGMAWGQRFSTGSQSPYDRKFLSSIRCVRG